VTTARSLLVPAHAPGTFHCVQRCVRRAFLCGVDDYSGRSFEHRREWIEQRLLDLANHFAVALLGYAVMSNHLHVVLHIDPTTAAAWSDDEVARRWTALFPPGEDSDAARFAKQQVLLGNHERLAVCRQRLGSLSWFMRCLAVGAQRLVAAQRPSR